jgi:hypothetical protein
MLLKNKNKWGERVRMVGISLDEKKDDILTSVE